MSERRFILTAVRRDATTITLEISVVDLASGGVIPITIGPVPLANLDGKTREQIKTYLKTQIRQRLAGDSPQSGLPIAIGEVFDHDDI